MLADCYSPFFLTNVALSFPRFRELPAELRLKIWQDALPDARTIHLVNDVQSTEEFTLKDENTLRGNRLNHFPFPAQTRSRRRSDTVSHCTATISCPKDISCLLHACRESRLEVLCRYEPLFAPKSLHDTLFGLHYFDPLRDGIFVDEIWPWVRGGRSKPTGLYNARILSISCNAWFFKWAVSSSQLLGKAGLLRFKHLKELHIVHRILTDHERERIMQYKFGQYMGPGDMTQFLHRPQNPHDIAFPSISVDIRVEPILAKFAELKAENPAWNIPKVKLMAWATRSDMTVISPTTGDLSFQ